MRYFSRHPMPPFLPASRVIVQGRWTDDGEWDDSAFMFPGTEPPVTQDYLATQTGAALGTQDGGYLIL